jgi:hypothetical protein
MAHAAIPLHDVLLLVLTKTWSSGQMCVVAENIWVTAAAPQNSVITFPPSVNPNSAAILHQHSGWQGNSQVFF